MLTKGLYNAVIAEQLRTMKGARAFVILHSGLRYSINEIVQEEDQYLVLAIYPPASTGGPESEIRAELNKLRKDRDNRPIFDRVIIGYEEISHIFMTTTEETEEVEREFGFHANMR